MIPVRVLKHTTPALWCQKRHHSVEMQMIPGRALKLPLVSNNLQWLYSGHLYVEKDMVPERALKRIVAQVVGSCGVVVEKEMIPVRALKPHALQDVLDIHLDRGRKGDDSRKGIEIPHGCESRTQER